MRLAPTLFACTLVLGACKGDREAELLISRQVEVMHDMAAVLEGIEDAPSTERAKPELQALGEELASLQADWEQYVANVGSEDAAAQTYRATTPDEIARAQVRLTAVFTRLAMNPELRGQMAELAGSVLPDD